MRLQAQNSEIFAELIMSGTNQITGINRDFRTDIIKIMKNTNIVLINGKQQQIIKKVLRT